MEDGVLRVWSYTGMSERMVKQQQKIKEIKINIPGLGRYAEMLEREVREVALTPTAETMEMKRKCMITYKTNV